MKSVDVLARQVCLHIGAVVSFTGYNEADAKMHQALMRQTAPYLQDVPPAFGGIADAARGYAAARGSRQRQLAEARLHYEVKLYFQLRLGDLDIEWRDTIEGGQQNG